MRTWRILLAAAIPAVIASASAGRLAEAEPAEHARERPQPPAAAVTFERAIGWVGELPELVAAREAAVAHRRLQIRSAWQPLALAVVPLLRLAPADARGIEGTASIEQPIPLARVTEAKRASVAAAAEQRAAAAAARALEARLAAAAAWIDCWTARERLATSTEDGRLAREILLVTERGLAAGAMLAAEVADARAFAAEAEVRRLEVEGQEAEACLRLGHAIGRTGAVASEGALPAPPVPAASTAEALVAAAQRMPQVAATRLAARASRARAVEERAVRSRQLIAGAQVARDAPDGFLVGVTIGLALPHDRGEREAREAELDARVAEGDAAGLARGAANELARALHEVEHTARLLAELRERLVPAAEDAAARRQRAYQEGSTTLVELLATQRTAVAARGRLAEARAAHAWARVRAWLLLQAAEDAS